MLNNHLSAVCLIAYLIIAVSSYQIRMGSKSLIPNHLNLSQFNATDKSFAAYRKKMFIFPYDIYEFDTLGSTTPLAKSFIFQRLSYDKIQANQTFEGNGEYDETQKLFNKLPEVVLVEGTPNEYLQILRHDQSLMNRNFIIKNSTVQKHKKYSLNFYSLNVHRYFYSVVREAKRKLHKMLKDTPELLSGDNLTEISEISLLMEDRKMYILDMINQGLNQSYLINQLLHLVMIREVSQTTKWSVRYNSFGTLYGSANVVEQGDIKYMDLEVAVLLSREGNLKRVQKFKEPLTNIKLSQISHLEICFQQQNYKLLLSDSHSFYLLDFTEQLWHLDSYKTFTDELLNVFLVGTECRVVTLQEADTNTVLNAWKNSLSKMKIQKNGQIYGSYAVCNEYFAICWSPYQCNLFDYKLNQVTALQTNLTEKNLQWYLRVKVIDQNINTEVEVVGSNRQLILGALIKNQSIFTDVDLENENDTLQNSIFWNFVYGLEVYMSRSDYMNAEMNRVMWSYLQDLSLAKDDSGLTSNYRKFIKEIQEKGVNLQNLLKTTASQIFFEQGNASDWYVCSVELETYSPWQMKMIFNSNVTNYDLYACEAEVQSANGDIIVQCKLIVKYSSEENEGMKLMHLKGNRYLKFYLVRREFSQEVVLPTIWFTDIEKSQIQYASSLATIIIATIGVCFILLILAVVIKPLVVSISIYYGWMQQREDFVYPLSWFNLKIKLKRLMDNSYLSYTIHRCKGEDDETHCCFCLQTVRDGKMAARLFCLHEFHKECFDEWIRNEPNPRCPTCRRQFTRSNFVDFQNSQQQMQIST